MNKCLKYFPVPPHKNFVSALNEEEHVIILNRAKPIEYHMDVLAVDYDPYAKSFQEYVKYIERLETKHVLRKKLEQNPNSKKNVGDDNGKKKKRKRTRNRNSTTSNGNKNEQPNCGCCDKVGHKTADCWEDPKNADKRPKGYRVKRQKMTQCSNQPNFSMEQMSFLMKNFRSLAKNKTPKRERLLTKVVAANWKPRARTFSKMVLVTIDKKLSFIHQPDIHIV